MARVLPGSSSWCRTGSRSCAGLRRGSERSGAKREVKRRSRAQACKRRDHCGGRNAALTGRGFLAQSLLERVKVEFAFRDNALSDGARLNGSKRLREPLVVDAV